MNDSANMKITSSSAEVTNETGYRHYRHIEGGCGCRQSQGRLKKCPSCGHWTFVIYGDGAECTCCKIKVSADALRVADKINAKLKQGAP